MLAGAKTLTAKKTFSKKETDFLEKIDAIRRIEGSNLKIENVRTRGQIFTPAHVARLMASLIEPIGEKKIRLLDAGAGTGMLTAACVKHLCKNRNKPSEIFVTVVEIDSKLLPSLKKSLELCRKECEKSGICFSFEIIGEDFLASAPNLSEQRFNLAILNPPYNKINMRSEANKLLRRQGIVAPNFYAAFLALCADLLEEDGELIAITPRSFCNGTYFKPFRKYLLERMQFTRFHVFESRREVFDADILQENIVFRAVKSLAKNRSVTITTSLNGKAAVDATRELAAGQLIPLHDEELFIHLDSDRTEEGGASPIKYFQTSLEDLGLKVSTGRVVDFRAAEFLRNGLKNSNGECAAPLIYPHNIKAGRVVYPVAHPKKFNAISCTQETASQLVENGTYVLVKRFSAKEEKKRINAALYKSEDAPGGKVGFENHLNYFHASGKQVELLLAKGLTLYLNSALLDNYFRHFSGHTQVNATDLRYLKYPTEKELKTLGSHFTGSLPSPAEIDELILKLIPDNNSR